MNPSGHQKNPSGHQKNPSGHQLKTVHIPNMDIRPPKSTSGDFDTPSMCIAGHCVVLCVGKRRSGKTTACTSLIEKMKFDYVIAVSATMASNKELMSRLNIQHEFDPDGGDTIDKIKEIVEAEATDLERYQEEMRRYRKLMKLIHSESPLFRLPEEDLAAFYKDGDFKPPEHKWNGRKPKIAVIFDDCLGSQVYAKPRKLNGLATYSRHIGQLKEGGAIGVSLFFLVQSYKCQAGGLNKVVRNQCTCLMVFRTKDQAEQDDIADSVAGEIDRVTFNRVYDEAIGDGEGHPFLLVDFAKRKEHPSMFRRRLNEFILPVPVP